MSGTATKMGFRALKANLGNAWRNDRRMLFKSVTAWVLFGGIIVVFIFLGQTPHHAGVATGGAAASVNGQIISVAEFSEYVENLSRSSRFAQLEQFGGDFARQMVRQQAIRDLVDQRLLGQTLGKIGVLTPDARIRDTIAEIPAFQEDGRFSRTRYLGYLQATRQTAGEFEDKLRRELATGQAARVFVSALRPLPFEADLLKAVEGKKANVEGVMIPTENLISANSVMQADVKAFLAKAESAARVKSYFDSHKSDFSQPEKAKVRHILVRANKSKPEEVAKAKAAAEAIEKQVKGGADFAKLATEKSEDPGSKTNGGLIDFFARGAMVPEFEKFAFSAKPGEISAPVQTEFGFHVIRLEDRKAASERKLEDVQEEIAQILVAQEQSRTEIANLEKSLSAGQVAEVQAFLTKHRLKWNESGAFALDAESLPKIGGGSEAVSMGFKLTSEKPYAAKLVRQGPEAILLRYKAVPAETKTAAKTPSKVPGADDAEAKSARRIQDTYNSWMDVLRKKATISISPEIGAQTAAADQ